MLASGTCLITCFFEMIRLDLYNVLSVAIQFGRDETGWYHLYFYWKPFFVLFLLCLVAVLRVRFFFYCKYCRHFSRFSFINLMVYLLQVPRLYLFLSLCFLIPVFSLLLFAPLRLNFAGLVLLIFFFKIVFTYFFSRLPIGLSILNSLLSKVIIAV